MIRRVADFTEQFTCQLPMPPSLNNIYRNAGKRRIKTDAYKAWCLECDWELARLKPPAFSLGRVDVSIYLAMPKRPSDIDNRIKPSNPSSCVQSVRITPVVSLMGDGR